MAEGLGRLLRLGQTVQHAGGRENPRVCAGGGRGQDHKVHGPGSSHEPNHAEQVHKRRHGRIDLVPRSD